MGKIERFFGLTDHIIDSYLHMIINVQLSKILEKQGENKQKVNKYMKTYQSLTDGCEATQRQQRGG